MRKKRTPSRAGKTTPVSGGHVGARRRHRSNQKSPAHARHNVEARTDYVRQAACLLTFASLINNAPLSGRKSSSAADLAGFYQTYFTSFLII